MKQKFREKSAQGDGVQAEPTELKLQKWLTSIGLILVPVVVLALYYKVMFVGLTNGDAFDFAQIGRNLGAGRGFTTFVLRPLALTHGTDVLRQPDVTHGPLYPLLLALAFGILHAKDQAVALVSSFFYVATVPMVFRLGTRVFTRTVGLLAALLFTFNSLMLEYAISGTHNTLCIFLMTCLLLALYELGAQERAESGVAQKLPRLNLVLVGILSGLLYLSDYAFFWVLLLVAGCVIWQMRRRAAGIAFYAVPMALLVLPWMLRNAALTGNPVFGLRGLEIMMNTQDHYPGFTAYRMTGSDLVQSSSLFQDIMRRGARSLANVIQSFPQIAGSWVLAFLLPGLLFRFADPAANRVRSVMMGCALALTLSMVVFYVEMPLFVSLIAGMLVFAVAFIIHLVQQANLTRGARAAVTAGLAFVMVYPLVVGVALAHPVSVHERMAMENAARLIQKDECVVSDKPWEVAWYADRPSLWIPASDTKISAFREQFRGTRWMILTEGVRGISNDWNVVYDQLYKLNVMAKQDDTNKLVADRNGQKYKLRIPEAIPLSVQNEKQATALALALKDFVWLRPAKEAAPNAVLAAVPLPQSGHSSKAAEGLSRTAKRADLPR